MLDLLLSICKFMKGTFKVTMTTDFGWTSQPLYGVYELRIHTRGGFRDLVEMVSAHHKEHSPWLIWHSASQSSALYSWTHPRSRARADPRMFLGVSRYKCASCRPETFDARSWLVVDLVAWRRSGFLVDVCLRMNYHDLGLTVTCNR